LPKFTSAERILLKSIVAILSIKRVHEAEIIRDISPDLRESNNKMSCYLTQQRIHTIDTRPCDKASLNTFTGFKEGVNDRNQLLNTETDKC
jgi:hypothetical protein